MTLSDFINLVKTNPTSITFADCIDVIEANYDFTETAFSNGDTQNAAGQNNGSCKIFAFAKLNNLTEDQALQCFGDYYRVDVLQNPQGDDHQNIRNFIQQGWAGVEFSGAALAPK